MISTRNRMPRILNSGLRMFAGSLALAAAACGRHGEGGAGEGGAHQQPQRPPATVRTATAEERDTPLVINAFGMTRDFQSVDVVPQVSGVLVKTFIQDGAIVTNGQPLFLIDPSDYTSRVAQAEAAVSADRANLELSRATVERNQPLRDKSLISAQDFDTLKTRHDALAAQLKVDEATLALARLNLARCQIAAPLAGICSRRQIDDGNLVAAGVTRLVNIRGYDPMRVDFTVPEFYLPIIRKAMAKGAVPIEIVPRGGTHAFTGTIDSIDNAVDPASGTIGVRGIVPNSDLKLWSQQFVDVHVVADTVAKAVMVPDGAVQLGKIGPFVFVVGSNSLAQLRPVQTGVRYAENIQILGGVAAGERVVVLGQLMLFPGAPVMEAPPPGAGPGPGPGAPAAGAPKAAPAAEARESNTHEST